MPSLISRLTNEAKCAGRNDALRRRNRSIGEIGSRGVVGDRTAVEELPGFAIRVDRPAADDACVKEIEPLLARPVESAHRVH